MSQRGDASVGRGKSLDRGGRRGGTGQGAARKRARKLPDDVMTWWSMVNDELARFVRPGGKDEESFGKMPGWVYTGNFGTNCGGKQVGL